jgi:mannose-6-phosphate isomerase-like protein (cupin superfamily)
MIAHRIATVVRSSRGRINVNPAMIDHDATPYRDTMSDDAWQVYDIHKLTAKLTGGAGAEYREFLREPSLSCGIYHLPKGARDMQSPHDEDEVYYVLSGLARMKVSGAEQEVRAGSVLYVRATEEHSFFEIEEDMVLLVFFAASA